MHPESLVLSFIFGSRWADGILLDSSKAAALTDDITNGRSLAECVAHVHKQRHYEQSHVSVVRDRAEYRFARRRRRVHDNKAKKHCSEVYCD